MSDDDLRVRAPMAREAAPAPEPPELHTKPKLIRASKSPEERQRLELDGFHDALELEDEIGNLQHRHLWQQAGRYLIPLPEHDRGEKGVWEESRITEWWRLTRPELVKLRSAIRSERKERFEAWVRWTPIISAQTGLMGLVVAFLALLRK